MNTFDSNSITSRIEKENNKAQFENIKSALKIDVDDFYDDACDNNVHVEDMLETLLSLDDNDIIEELNTDSTNNYEEKDTYDVVKEHDDHKDNYNTSIKMELIAVRLNANKDRG